MKKISWVGVAVGNVVDIFATTVSSVIVLVLFAATRADPFAAQSGETEGLMENLARDPAVLLVSGGIGVVCSILAGYVAASIAKHDERLNGTLTCLLGSAITIWTMITMPAAQQPEQTVLTVVLSISGGWLGGFLRAKFKKKFDPSAVF